MDLTPKQQASEAIRQAESILVVTAQRPNIDQVASVVALTHALRKMGKKVAPLVSDRVPGGAKFFAGDIVESSLNGLRDFIMQVDLGKAEVDKVKYTVENGKLNIHVTPYRGGFTQADVTFSQGDYHFDLIIALGVPSRSRLDRIFEQNPNLLATVPMLNVDYHRINEQHGAINLIESNSSTLSEMVLALTESVQGGLLDDKIATALLAGIMANTDRFTAQHTTAKSLTVAAQMMAMGGDQQRVIREIFGSRESSGAKRQESGNRLDQTRQNQGTTRQDSGSSTRRPEPGAREEQSARQPQAVAPVEEVAEQAPSVDLHDLKNPEAPEVNQTVAEVVADEPEVDVEKELDSFIHGDDMDNDLIYTQPAAIPEATTPNVSLEWEQGAQAANDPLINS